jgi:hypothetical protein
MMTPGDDAQLAMACQLEEYAKKNAHLEDALSRERSRKASLEQQWKSLMEQVRVLV